MTISIQNHRDLVLPFVNHLFQSKADLNFNGMNALSRREEETLLKATKSYALKECDDVVKEFATCASGRTVSVAWSCRKDLERVQECMVQFTAPEPMEQVRKEYLRLRNLQQRQSSQQSS